MKVTQFKAASDAGSALEIIQMCFLFSYIALPSLKSWKLTAHWQESQKGIWVRWFSETNIWGDYYSKL